MEAERKIMGPIETGSQPPAPIAPGGDTPLDFDSEKDRAMVRNAIRRWPKRWRGHTPEKKERYAELNALAAEKAAQIMEADDPNLALAGVQAVNSCVRVAVAMESQEQADDIHLDAQEQEDRRRREDQKRLDEGKASAVVKQEHTIVLRPPVLPHRTSE